MPFVSNFTDSNTMNNDKIINRDVLQDDLIQQILDDMDIKTMMAILYDSMSEDYDKFSDEELIRSEEYYPHLLPEPNISELEFHSKQLHHRQMNMDWMTEPQIEELVNFQYADDEQALKELMEEEEFKFDNLP